MQEDSHTSAVREDDDLVSAIHNLLDQFNAPLELRHVELVLEEELLVSFAGLLVGRHLIEVRVIRCDPPLRQDRLQLIAGRLGLQLLPGPEQGIACLDQILLVLDQFTISLQLLRVRIDVDIVLDDLRQRHLDLLVGTTNEDRLCLAAKPIEVLVTDNLLVVIQRAIHIPEVTPVTEDVVVAGTHDPEYLIRVVGDQGAGRIQSVAYPSIEFLFMSPCPRLNQGRCRLVRLG
ncbi:hypothetical protein D3C76_852880 [compost metagenome]